VDNCGVCGPCLDKASENPTMKMGCHARRCQRRVAIVQPVVTPPPALVFIPESLPAKALVAAILLENPSMAAEVARQQAKDRWDAGMAALGLGGEEGGEKGGAAVDEPEAAIMEDPEPDLERINPDELGFAKTPGRTFYPARRQAHSGVPPVLKEG
jgi:hypothetical protein